MAFVLLLTIAVGSLAAVGLVVVGLVEAPWQLLLLGLLAALYGLQRQVGATEVEDLSNPSPESALTNRADAPESSTLPSGSLNSDPLVATFADENASRPQDGDELTYRGIRYSRPKLASDLPPGESEKVEGTYRGQHWQR
ncbi:DUF4278 domain-containing protein [Nodosilinea sp. LEGE 07088]|uniref:DUF4278 domain-containing protein n=1 Tax=Nodosilinea sp. LEGE 07088 TaxID=2777968 RepID=UPI00187E837A|nr:DUF4278 domain-containing protein [Nodosilinea sp. LEGE 07088]MBE9136575.1 DUF4278 domain-containing protein [Nodosilinea sp. LEGE 07088]